MCQDIEMIASKIVNSKAMEVKQVGLVSISHHWNNFLWPLILSASYLRRSGTCFKTSFISFLASFTFQREAP